jgi:hypothetical protein
VGETRGTHGVMTPRLDNVVQLGARVKEQKVPPLLVADVQRVVAHVDPENAFKTYMYITKELMKCKNFDFLIKRKLLPNGNLMI